MKLIYKYLFLIILTQISYCQSMNFDMLHGINNPNLVGDSIKLEKRTFNAFKKMEKAALMDGIELKIVSAYRSYERQKTIWNNKYLRFTEDYNLEPEKAINEISSYVKHMDDPRLVYQQVQIDWPHLGRGERSKVISAGMKKAGLL